MILGLWGSKNTLIFTLYSLIVISSNSLQLRAFRNIRPLPCVSKSTGGVGVCMFAWDCMKNNGTHLGTCIDRFYFGSCCVLPGKETELSNEVIPLPHKKPHKPVSVHVWLENSSAHPPSSVSPQVNTQLNVILSDHSGTDSSTPQSATSAPGTTSIQTKISEVTTVTIPTSSQGTSQISTESFSSHVTNDDGITLATTLATPASASSTLKSTDVSTSTNTAPTTDAITNPSTASSTAEGSPTTPSQTTVTSSVSLSTVGDAETDISSTISKTTQNIVVVSTTQSTTFSTTENTRTTTIALDSSTQTIPSGTTQAAVSSTTQSTPASTTQTTGAAITQSTPMSTTQMLVTNSTENLFTIDNESTSTNVALVSDDNSTFMISEITTSSPFLNSSLSNDVTDNPTIPPSTSDMLLDSSTAPAEASTKYQEELLETTTTSMKPSSTSTITSLSSLATVTMSTTESVTFLPDESTTAPAVTTTLDPSDYRQVCGKQFYSSGRIVGGAKAEFGEWPWQVSLRQWRGGTFLHKCGAALLNENWVITAAHCVENIPPDEILLRLGEYDLGREDEPYGYVEKKVQIIASHPQFESRTFEYDLALLRFFEPVKFQPNIIPICVPETDYSFVGDHGYVTGWGRLYEDGPLPSVLQEVSVPVVNNSICEDMYRSAGYIESIPHIFLCAGTFTGGMDSCEGDSGGPLVIQMKNGKWYLAGIISWGIGCAEPNQPGVYTRISEFRDWINQILQF